MTDAPASAARAMKSKPLRRPSAAGANPANRMRVPSPDPASEPQAAGPSDRRPLPKRQRRTLASCKPCRVSKSKCDEDRPCGSCRLRGTEAQCIHESLESGDASATPIRDPLSELGSIRKSLNAIEVYIRNGCGVSASSERPDPLDFLSLSPTVLPGPGASLPSIREGASVSADAPGQVGRRTGGLYSGPTSLVTPLILSDDDDSFSETSNSPADYDSDLLHAIPSLEVVDSMIEYYFTHCCWVYTHVNETAFRKAWDSYKGGLSTDRLTLATCCLILATTFYFMPERHLTRISLVHSFGATPEPGHRFFMVMKEALGRYQSDNSAYSLELLELTLLSGLYMTVSGQFRGEEGWQVKGLCVTMALAMGLHRDPGKWKVPLDVADRRRVAWWNVIVFDRWHAHLLGRPITIAMHHFDTQFPSYLEPAYPAAGKSYVGNLELQRLAAAISPLLDDAVSLQPVSYATIQRHDRSLVQWLQGLHPELDLSESQLQEGFESDDLAARRRAVVSCTIRGVFYNFRFILHRPYATRAHAPHSEVKSPGDVSPLEISQSTEIAASSAERVITLSSQARVYWPTETVFATGHLNWLSFHVFNASMFFSLQLIAAPGQPAAALFRQNVGLGIQTLRQAAAVLPPAPGVARKGLAVLEMLAPLYASDFSRRPPAEQAAEKVSVFAVVRRLAFPFQDREVPGQQVNRSASSPSTASTNQSSHSAAPSQPMVASSSNGVPSVSLSPSGPSPTGMSTAAGAGHISYSHSIPHGMQVAPAGVTRTQSAVPTPPAHPAHPARQEHARRETYSAPPPSATFPGPYRTSQPPGASFTAPGIRPTPGWHPEYDPPEHAFTVDPPAAQAQSHAYMGQLLPPLPTGTAMPSRGPTIASSAPGQHAHLPLPTAPHAPFSFSPVDEHMGPLPAAGSAPASLNPDVQWGASVGMTQGEWAQFSHDMQSHPGGMR